MLESFYGGAQTAEAIESMAGACLKQAGLVIHSSSGYALTHMGDELLDDGFGHHIEDQIRTAHERYGYDAALGRLRTLISASLSPCRLEERALAVVVKILADLHYKETSFAAHEALLQEITTALTELLDAVEEDLAAQIPDTRQAEEALRLRNRPALAIRARTRGFKASLRRAWESAHHWLFDRSTDTSPTMGQTRLKVAC